MNQRTQQQPKQHNLNNQQQPNNPQHQPQLNVVLDLDETLVHAKIAGQSGISQYGNVPSTDDSKKMCEDTIDIRLNTENEELVSVNRRPGLQSFLNASSKKFKLFAFTASESFYAHPLLDAIDPQRKYFGDRRFSRDSCTQIGEGRYTKDLCKIALSGQETKNEREGHWPVEDSWFQRIVLVDNNPFSFVPQPKNGVPVVSWYHNPEDVALSKVYQFLEQLEPLKDVRPYLDATFHVQETLNKFAQTNGDDVFRPVNTTVTFGK
jgi:TFIIF-interacting CTD phosphatase-like protein